MNTQVRPYKPEHCLRHKGIACSVCLEACPTKALSWVGTSDDLPHASAKLHRNDKLCKDCGLCSCVCPISIFAPAKSGQSLLLCLEHLPHKETLLVFCPGSHQNKFPPHVHQSFFNAVRIPSCPSSMHMCIAAALPHYGVKKVEYIVGECEKCFLCDNGLNLIKSVQIQNSILPMHSNIIQQQQKNPEWQSCTAYTVDHKKISRGRFLKKILKILAPKKPDQQSVHLATEHWKMPQHPELRLELIKAMRSYTSDLNMDRPVPASLSAKSPRIKAKACKGCGICTRACPSGALAASTGCNGFMLMFTAALCMGCGQCLQVCPENALKNNKGALTIRQWLSTTSITIKEHRQPLKREAVTDSNIEGSFHAFSAGSPKH